MGQRLSWRVGLAAALLLLAALACSVNVSTAHIKSAKLAKDEAGTEKTTVYQPGDTFYCLVELGNAPDDTKTKAVWKAANVEGVEANHVIDEVEQQQGSGVITFRLTNDQPWPAGSYSVEIYLNREKKETLPFSVE